jgi:non-ribosomal peptide synthase protein (TIGR01720 family)
VKAADVLHRGAPGAEEAAQARLDPERGVVVQAVWTDAGPARPGRLLLLLHHLVVDGISWRVLLPDLAAAWEAVAAGVEPRLQPVRTSFRRWAQRLAAAAGERTGELPLWREALATPDPALGAGPLDPDRDTAHTARALSVTMPAEATEAVLGAVPAALHAEVNDVLLAAFATAVAGWRRRHGRGDGTAVVLDLEGHGREDVVGGADLSRTVGWFTSLYPVRLDPGAGDIGAAVARVKEQLRAIPDKGIGYGMLRHLDPVAGPELAARPGPQIGFNYLGRFAAGGGGTADWTPVADGGVLGGGSDAGLALAHVIEVNAITEDRPGGPRLTATWAWAPALLAEAEVRDLADAWFAALEALVEHVRSGGAGGVTPSDISLVALSQDELDEFEDDDDF